MPFFGVQCAHGKVKHIGTIFASAPIVKMWI
jgi:hypothetical protein